MAATTRRLALIQAAPRTVIGYHGCPFDVAEQILSEQQFSPSTKAYDWLGEGVYFWEYAPYRALDRAISKCKLEGGTSAVIRATIKLGRCLNLLDIEHIPRLAAMYVLFVEMLGEENLPRNTERGAHFLDREIIVQKPKKTMRTKRRKQAAFIKVRSNLLSPKSKVRRGLERDTEGGIQSMASRPTLA